MLTSGLLVGVLLSVVGARLPWVDRLFTSNTDGTPGTAYVEVDLLRDNGSNVTVVWNGTVTCPHRDTYRQVYGLPPAGIDQATGYLVPHADCPAKVFQEAGGVGYGELLIPDGRVRPLSPHTWQHSASVVIYSAGEPALTR